MPAEIPDGAVLVARAILNSSLWTMRPEDRIVAMTCIALASWRPGKWWDGCVEVKIERGQFVRSWEGLAKACGLSVKSTRTSVQNLEKAGFLARLRAGRYSLYTLPKYDFYQDITRYSDSAGKTSGSSLAGRGQVAGNIQEGNKRNEGKENTIPAKPTPSEPPREHPEERHKRVLEARAQVEGMVPDEPSKLSTLEFLGILESDPAIPGKRIKETIWKLCNMRQSLVADNGLPVGKLYNYAIKEAMKHDARNASYVGKVMQNAVMRWRDGALKL